MILVLNKKISGFLCVIPLVYFAGITLYSLLPEITNFIDYNSIFWKVYYWANNTIFLFSLIFTFSYLIADRLTKLIIRGTSFFLLTLGIFQIIKTMGFSINKSVWISICPSFIIFILISYLYVSYKLQK